MNFDTYFRTTSYALVATAFMAVALTGELDGISILLYTLALVLSFSRDVRGQGLFGLREWMWRALSLAYVPFIFIDATMLSHSRVVALVHLTLFVSAAKLFQNKRDRDWVFLYLIAFFQMLLAAGLTFDTTFIASLIAFLFFFVSTLAAFEIRRAQREVTPVGSEVITRLKKPRRVKYRAKEEAQAGRGRVRYLVSASVAQVALVGILTLPFFFLIPRFGGGGVASALGDGQALTGFSDTVQLGDVASIKESRRVVMRVQLDRKPNRFLRWRGVALDYYDGRKWSVRYSSDPDHTNQSDGSMFRQGEGRFEKAEFDRSHNVVKLPEQPDPRHFLFDQKIVLEPLKIPTLFAAHKLAVVRGPIPKLFINKDTGAVSAAVGLRGRTSYLARSDIRVPTEQELRASSTAAYPEAIKQLYLQLPRGRDAVALDPRVARLAEEESRGALTPYDRAKAIETFLKTRFGYTLNLKPAKEDPLAEFLFDTREGHCEYFATAMVVMLRTLGIPARIVNGFQMGEYNDISDLYTVREHDAHSWVEAYFPQLNAWVEFDPTPAAGINNYSQAGVAALLRKYIEAAEVFWLDYIVTLDSEEQATIMVELQQRLLGMKDRLMGYYLVAKQWVKARVSDLAAARRWDADDALRLGSALGVLLLGLLGFYAASAYRKRAQVAPTGYGPWWYRIFILPTWRRRRLIERDHRASAVLFYEQMLALASLAGLVKSPDQTPIEFASATQLKQVREITQVYNRVRFGSARLDETESRRVSALLAELKQAVKQTRRKTRRERVRFWW